MKLPFVKHLRRYFGDTRYQPLTFPVDYTYTEYVEEVPRDDLDVVVCHEVKLFVSYRVKESLLQAARRGEEAALGPYKERAVRALARELYGPLQQELILIEEMLWKDGLHHTEGAKRLSALIPVLNGEEYDNA